MSSEKPKPSILVAFVFLLGSAALGVHGENREQSNTSPAANTLSMIRPVDLQKAQGTWNVVRHASNGLGFGKLDGSGEPLGPQVIIIGDRLTLQYRPDDPMDAKYVYVIKRIDDRIRPKQVDVAFEKDGKTSVREGIYSLEKDVIRCECARPGDPRPRTFGAPRSESPTNLLILRRTK